MKIVALGTLVLATALAIVPSVRATPVNGNMAIAGLNNYTLSNITFPAFPPSFVFTSSGSLAAAMPVGSPVHLNNIEFATAVGLPLFDFMSGTVVMTIETWNVQQNTAQFLNIHGLATMDQTGFDPFQYDFTIASTRVSGFTAYLLNLTPVPEPGSLFLVGTGLLGLAGALFRRAKKPTSALP